MVRGNKILIADDEPDILEIIEFNLQANGYDVTTAKNGDEAFEKAKKIQPDLIILDIMMPGKNGIEVCNLLRMMPAFKETLIVFLTALSDWKQVPMIISQNPSAQKFWLARSMRCSEGSIKKKRVSYRSATCRSTVKNTVLNSKRQISYLHEKNLNYFPCLHRNQAKFF